MSKVFQRGTAVLALMIASVAFIMKSCSAGVAVIGRSSRAASTPRPRLHALRPARDSAAIRHRVDNF